MTPAGQSLRFPSIFFLHFPSPFTKETDRKSFFDSVSRNPILLFTSISLILFALQSASKAANRFSSLSGTCLTSSCVCQNHQTPLPALETCALCDVAKHFGTHQQLALSVLRSNRIILPTQDLKSHLSPPIRRLLYKARDPLPQNE